MGVQFRAAATGFSSWFGGQVDLPLGIQVNDLIVAVQEVNTLANASGVPGPGWNKIESSNGSGLGGSQFAELYWKRADGSDAGSQLLFPATPESSAWKAVNVAVYYSNTAGKVVNVAASDFRGETTSTDTHAVPIVPVGELPALVVSAIGKKGSTVESITQPSGYTMRGTPCIIESGSNCGCAIADLAPSATGDISSASWTTNVANQAATTFSLVLTEGDTPTPPAVPKPAFRRWNGSEWSLVG